MPGPVFLDGEAVSLRTIETDDIEFLQRWVNDERIWRPIGSYAPNNAEQETKFFEEVVSEGTGVNLLIAVDQTPIGTIALESIDQKNGVAELGYWIAPDYWNEGFGTEAVELLLSYAFDQRRLHKVTARVYGFNSPSRRLLEGVGFVAEGVQREQAFLDGEYADTHWYGLLKHEWRGQ